MRVIESRDRQKPKKGALAKLGTNMAGGSPTLATVVRADLQNLEQFSPEYRAWLERRRPMAAALGR